MEKLNGSNYRDWKFAIYVMLKWHGLYIYIYIYICILPLPTWLMKTLRDSCYIIKKVILLIPLLYSVLTRGCSRMKEFLIYCLTRELFLAVEVSISYFRPKGMVYAIVLGSPSRAI